MLSQDLDQLATLVPQYLHRGEFELTAGGNADMPTAKRPGSKPATDWRR